jgi:hypothetical protein
MDQLKRELALTITIAFIALIFIICFAPVRDTGRDILLVLTGTLVGIVKDIYCFYFGSSLGSERKTELLSHAAPVQADQP